MGTDHLVRLSSGVRMSYREVGPATGRPVLYLHGTPSSRMEVGGTLSDEAATLGLRILAPDRPGYGRTPFVQYDVRDYPEHIMGLLDVLEVGRVGIIGVSGGGRYACAARSGSRVSRTALVASPHPPTSMVCAPPGAREIGSCTHLPCGHRGCCARIWP